jgi:hypothetical protein
VLTLARVCGAAWHEDLCRDAAYHGDFELLKWLHAVGCPWQAFDAAINSIRGKSRHSGRQYERILHWLFSTVEEWSQEDKNELLFEAGILFDAPALKLMVAQGADWPSSFIGKQMVEKEIVRACWDYRAVASARSKGSSWGVWRCQDLAPELYADRSNRAAARRLFKWAHKHDCPCTCEAAAADGAPVVAA